MPLTHVPNQKRRSSEPEQPTEETGFSTAFAPPPPLPAAEPDAIERPTMLQQFVPVPPIQQVETPLVEEAPIGFAPPPSALPPRPLGPTANVKMLNQVDSYSPGSVVPTACFSDIERLLRLGSVEYTNEAASAQPVDETIATGMRLAAPVVAANGIPRAPWVQSSIQDILGPALPGTGKIRTGPGYLPSPLRPEPVKLVIGPDTEGFADIVQADK